MALLPSLTTLALVLASTNAVPQIPAPRAAFADLSNKTGNPVLTPTSRTAEWSQDCFITRHGYCKSCFYWNRGACYGVLFYGRAAQQQAQHYTDKFPGADARTDYSALVQDENVAADSDMLKCMGFAYTMVHRTACTVPRDDEYFKTVGLMTIAKQHLGGDMNVVREDDKWVVAWDVPDPSPIPRPQVDDDFGGLAPAMAPNAANTWNEQGALNQWTPSFAGNKWASNCNWSGSRHGSTFHFGC